MASLIDRFYGFLQSDRRSLDTVPLRLRQLQSVAGTGKLHFGTISFSRNDAGALRDAIQGLSIHASNQSLSIQERREAGEAWRTIERLTDSPISIPGEDAATWTFRLRMAAWKVYCSVGSTAIKPADAVGYLYECQDTLRVLPVDGSDDRGGTDRRDNAEGDSLTQTAATPSAEDRVSECCSKQPDALIADVVKATGLTERQVQQTDAWDRHQNDRLRRLHSSNPEWKGKQLAKAIGVSQAKLSGMPTWKEIQRQTAALREGRAKIQQAVPSPESAVASKHELLHRLPLKLRKRLEALDTAEWASFLTDLNGTAIWEKAKDDADSFNDYFKTLASAWLDARSYKPDPEPEEAAPAKRRGESAERERRQVEIERRKLAKQFERDEQKEPEQFEQESWKAEWKRHFGNGSERRPKSEPMYKAPEISE